MKHFTLSFTLFILAFKAFSADAPPTRAIIKQPMMWTRITNTLVIDSHWYVYAEADNRVFLDPVAESQALFRLMGRYVLNPNIEFGLGGVSSLGFPNDPKASPRLLIPEWRACVDMTFRQKFGKVVSVAHRYVFENRFTHNATSKDLTDGYKYSARFRYRAQFDFLLWKKKNQSLKFILSDEIMLQAGKGIVYNVFDQNRAYAALNYEPLKWLAFEAGYLNLFQQRSTGKDFYNRHIFRFSVFTKIFIHSKNK
jgi:hypothetical protein